MFDLLLSQVSSGVDLADTWLMLREKEDEILDDGADPRSLAIASQSLRNHLQSLAITCNQSLAIVHR